MVKYKIREGGMRLFSKKKKAEGAKIGDLAKGVEKREKESLAVGDKPLKPSTAAALKVIRTVVWTLIVIVFILGIYQVVVSKRPKVVENIYKYEFAESESEKAKTLAESFVREYLTFDGVHDDYRERVKGYLVSGIALSNPLTGGKSKVTDTKVWSVEKLDDNHSNIVVRAEVVLVNPNKLVQKYDANGKVVSMPTEITKTIYVSVPIGADSGKVIVDDYPAFVPTPNLANIEMQTYSSEDTLEKEDEEEVKKTLTDFLQVYHEGTAGQIKYFFEEDPKIDGLKGSFTFSRIVSFQGYTNGEGKATAIVVVESKEKELETVFNQRYLFTLTRVEDRWIIDDMKNRGMEANEDDSKN